MNFKTGTLVATRASSPPSREDRRQTPRGGLVGFGNRRPPPLGGVVCGRARPRSTMFYFQWTGRVRMAWAFLPFQSTNGGPPPAKKINIWAGPGSPAGPPTRPPPILRWRRSPPRPPVRQDRQPDLGGGLR